MFNFTEFPPAIPETTATAEFAATDKFAPSEKYLKDLAWSIYFMGMAANLADSEVSSAENSGKLRKGAADALHTALESFIGVVNPVNKFLTDYVNELESGKWPPVPVGMPPPVSLSKSNLQNMLSLVDAVINTAIAATSGAQHDEIADLLKKFDTAVKNVITTVDMYYPQWFA